MTKRIRLFFVRWGPAVLLMAIIFIASATPSTELPDFGWVDLLVKKGGHFCAYFLLAAVCLRGVEETSTGRWQAFWICVLYAISDEFHQQFVPGRNAAVADVVIDASGAAVVILLCRYYPALKKKLRAGM